MSQAFIQPGFIVLHSNQSESLAQALVAWLGSHPLDPLEEEVILVQSNGMAEWLKMELASLGGIYAATRIELPAQFLWRTYRQVLGADAVPKDSPLDRIPMTWRLMQLLPKLLLDPDFAPIKAFLVDGEADRKLQLANRLADQFDQYQIYRADWLEDWAAGQDRLRLADGSHCPVPQDQTWQPKLWRELVLTRAESQQSVIRPRLHEQVLEQMRSGASLQGRVARRVLVFCVSQFPWSSLQALAALSAHSQVMFAVFNPCRFYWGDIIEGRELLRAARRRQPVRQDVDLGALPFDEMHDHANPLLASWGRLGRDFIRMLDEFDDAQQTRLQFEQLRIDLFDDSTNPEDSMLRKVQNQIRDLEPVSESRQQNSLSEDDRSIVFHVGHSKVRELEILHDQLLEYLSPGQARVNQDGQALQPRDIVVMVPDIEQMAPAIRAVFGQYKSTDPRFIPFDISDLGAKADSPLISAIEWLLRIPQQRCRMSELIDLLEVPAVAARFGIDQEDLPTLTQWMAGAGIRWGLNAEQRADLELDACGEQNTALFGLKRMLLGFCKGRQSGLLDRNNGFASIDPYEEIGGLDAELVGSLAYLLEALTRWWQSACTEATTADWVQRCRELLQAMVLPVDDADKQALSSLNTALEVWQRACEQAAFTEMVPLAIARSAWMEALNRPTLSRRFRAGGVTFCSLMPLRVIPFEVVCLLGMNEGDYPRATMRNDFDLMNQKEANRPGDRSRREDDRQLMLEALLSARQILYVSWCGRSVRDNSEQPPSVLVAQLRDYLSAIWGDDCVKARTIEHPLQPFSRQYFEKHSALTTYASEWRVVHGQEGVVISEGIFSGAAKPLPSFTPAADVALTMAQLTTFLRNPVKAFFRERFSVSFEDETLEDFDEESFEVDGLQAYALLKELLAQCPATLAASQVESVAKQLLCEVQQAGRLPLKAFGDKAQQAFEAILSTMLRSWALEQSKYVEFSARHPLNFEHQGLVVDDWLLNLLKSEQSSSDASSSAESVVVRIEFDAGKLRGKDEKQVPTVRAHKLLSCWVSSLVSSACGIQVRTVLIGQDAVVRIEPMPRDFATKALSTLLDVWREGMNKPLPLPPKTALASLEGGEAAIKQYEGEQYITGEVLDMWLAREFPDYASLVTNGLHQKAHEIYQPLLQWKESYVSIEPHSEASATQDDEDSTQLSGVAA